jgi:hypothetical protein
MITSLLFLLLSILLEVSVGSLSASYIRYCLIDTGGSVRFRVTNSHYELGLGDDYVLTGIPDKVDFLDGDFSSGYNFPCIVGSLVPFDNSILVCETKLSNGNRYIYFYCDDGVAIKNIIKTNIAPITPIGYFSSNRQIGKICFRICDYTVNGAQGGLIQKYIPGYTGTLRTGSFFKDMCGESNLPKIQAINVTVGTSYSHLDVAQVIHLDNTNGESELDITLSNEVQQVSTRTVSVDRTKSTTTSKTMGWNFGTSASVTATEEAGVDFWGVSASASLSVSAEVHSEVKSESSVTEQLQDQLGQSMSIQFQETNAITFATTVPIGCSIVVNRLTETVTQPYQSFFSISSSSTNEQVTVNVQETRSAGYKIVETVCE